MGQLQTLAAARAALRQRCRAVHCIVWLVVLFVPAAAAAAESGTAELTTRAVAELGTMQQIHEKTWGMSKAESVTLDQDDGKIIWTFRDGRIVEAPVQIVGTYNSSSAGFLWSWANHTVLPQLQGSANQVRAYGEAHAVADFTSRLLTISPARAWELTAVANHLGRAKGAFRANAGGLFVYVTFGKVSLRAGGR